MSDYIFYRRGKSLIEVKNLSKTYGNIKAIKDLSFTVNKGEILGFLGPNGAGKSTTMKIITGYISPSKGTVLVGGFDIMDDDLEVKKRIGYLPENPPLYNDMTVKTYLKFVAEIKGIHKSNIDGRVNETLEMLNLEDVGNRIIKNLSKGYKQRVGLAQAILGDPDVLILDEPTIGLDPSQIIEIRSLIKKLSEDRTIILSTHILPEVSQLCDRVIIINKGEIAAIDTPDNLAKRFRESNTIEVRIIGQFAQVMDAIKSIDGVVKVDLIGEKEQGAVDYKIETDAEIDIRQELFNKMAENNFKVIELKTVNLSLEDIFLQLTTSEPQSAKEKEDEAKTKEDTATRQESEQVVENTEEKGEQENEKNNSNI